MRKLGAWIGADAAVYAFGIAEPITERVEMMDRHDAQSEPAEVLLPGHPMWDAAHLDGGEDRFANRSVFQKGFGSADRLVETHVLVYGQSDSGGFTRGDGFDCFGVIHAERLLSEDAFDSFARAGGFDESELGIWRHGDIENLDIRIVEKLFVVFVDGGNSMAVPDASGVLEGAGCNCDGIEASLAIGDEMTIIDNKTASENADAKIFSAGQGRMDV